MTQPIDPDEAADRRDPDTTVSEDSERNRGLQQRREAAEELRRTSLAADPSRGRRQSVFYIGAGVMLAVCALAIVLMKQAPAPVVHEEKPKIHEDAPSPGKLADTPAPQPIPVSSVASGKPMPTLSSTPGDAAADAAERAERESRRVAAEAKRRKEEEMRQARIRSAIFAPDAGGQVADVAGEEGSAGGGLASAGGGSAGGPVSAQHGQGLTDANSLFARAVADSDDAPAKATRITNRQCKIEPGYILEGHLIPRIVSDLPGAIAVMLDRDAFGEEGRIPLLPWGTRITGQPNSTVRKGQDRTFIATATAYRPDGVKIRLNSPVADQLGSAGLDGDVDNHFGQILGMSAVLSLLGAGASNVGASTSNGANSASVYRDNVQQSLAQSSQQLLGGYAAIQPTITNPQGSRVRIQVEHELDFSDYCKPASQEIE
ncbi:conjugation TrbI family protein [Caballeronia calidae]|uniref:Conjugation TrbI family protein n=1 Tax=Caballeronia calidae TaxID=1777139 RepID=A0A158EE90_9BURK|nr:TrbI/VirB10 family protein [Caballeronia calidae]SAL05212.1 conjugation TrbI family protein [Caballeronia calidae]